MARTRSLIAVAVALMLCLLFVPRAALAQTQAAAQSGLCELQIEGQSIASLTLFWTNDSLGPDAGGPGGQQFVRPGKSLWLPAGRYYVSSVKLDGGYNASGDNFSRAREYLELSPDEPCRLSIGAPLYPQLSVSRHGKFLEMDCDLVDAGGRVYSWSGTSGPRPAPPGFTVYKNDQVLGTGTFEYG